ncbi:MAG TPA: YncE family protein, partial [Sunxiuqinia sp.]|nr:YncE family protein [Sunxiuqinia sp.]
MKYFSRALYSLLMLVMAFAVQAQNKRIQKKYTSSYETQTLNSSESPVIMPFNRWVKPAGEQIYFGDRQLENHALDCASSPDGKWIAVEGRYALVIVSPTDKKIVENLPLKSHFKTENVMGTFSGIQWRKQGENYELYWSVSNSSGKSYVVQASWNGRKAKIEKTFALPAQAPAKTALPNEVLVNEENGRPVLYVVLNGNNTLEKLDIATGKTIWSKPTGVAPYGIAMAKGKLYVTNWAGSVPDKNDTNVAGVPLGSAKVDEKTGATREGTVSVFDPKTGDQLNEIKVGLHPNDIICSPDQQFVYVANANSDAVSVINIKNDEVAETIPVRLAPDKNSYFGDSPNGLGISSNGQTLYVACGMDNAVSVV